MPEYGDPQNPFVIPIPGWDDLIKIHPRLKSGKEWDITRRDWAIYFALKERDELEKFTPREKMLEMLRRHTKYEMLRASPTPEVVKSITKIITAIDDTEDLLSTALVLGKILVKKAPWLAARLGTRFIPILGWILTVRDLMEVGNIVWRSLPCGRKGKGQMKDMVEPWNITKKGRMKRVAKFLARKPGIPELIEAAQATETLFGTGIQIGPIFGLLYDFVFGAIRAAAGQTVTIKFSPDRGELSIKDRIMQGMAASTQLVLGMPVRLQETHMLSLVSYALGIQMVQDIVSDEEMIRRSDEVLGWEVPHVKPWDQATRTMLEELGEDPDRDEPHFLPGSPEEVTLGELIDIFRGNALDVIKLYAEMFPGGEEGAFVATTIKEVSMWQYNLDLPVEEWEEYEPEWELSPAEFALEQYFF